MPYTSYVLDSDGVMGTVKDWTTVEETLVEDYQEGQTYRDEFDFELDDNTPSTSAHFSADDGATFDLSMAVKARVPDSMMHVPPRSEAVKQTRLRFKDAAGIIIAQYKPGEWTKWSNEPFRRI